MGAQKGPVYLLDLDNTLHHASRFILPEIHRQMTQYLIEHLGMDLPTANHLRDAYWRRYGATLLGLIEKHHIDPHHFLHHTHQFDNVGQVSHRHGSIPKRLSRLPGTRLLLTNAPRAYAEDVLRAYGLHKAFHGVVSIEDMVVHRRWRPKPSTWLWQRLAALLPNRHVVLVDDTRGHLHSAARHGYQTVWITFPGLGFKPLPRKGRQMYRITQFEQLARVPVHTRRSPGLS